MNESARRACCALNVERMLIGGLRTEMDKRTARFSALALRDRSIEDMELAVARTLADPIDYIPGCDYYTFSREMEG